MAKYDPVPLLAIQFVRLASLDMRLCQRIRVYHRIAIWGFLKMGDPHVALGFNSKSWSNDLDHLGLPYNVVPPSYKLVYKPH